MMSQNLKPTVLTLSVLAALSANTSFAADVAQNVDKNLLTSLGYGNNEQALLKQSGGSPIFDELGEELANAIVLDELNTQNYLAQNKSLPSKKLVSQSSNKIALVDAKTGSSEFQPLQIEGTLSSIYDFVSLEDGEAQLAQVTLPEDLADKKIIYAKAVQEDLAQYALQGSSIVVADNPYARMSTDEAVALLEKQTNADIDVLRSTEKSTIAIESVAPSEDELFAPETLLVSSELQKRNPIQASQQLQNDLGYAADSVDADPLSHSLSVSATGHTLDPASVIDDSSQNSQRLIANADTADIVESAATNTVSNDVENVASTADTVVDNAVESTTEVVDSAEAIASDTVENAGDVVDQQQQQTALEIAQNAQKADAASTVSVPATVSPQPTAEQASTPATPTETASMVPAAKPVNAGDALKQKDGDATSEKSLEEVFTASEKRYSLLKQGNWGLNYDARYSYYRDSRVDIATRENSSDIVRFRIEDDAQHTLTNSFNVQYGLKDNLTLSADLPIVAKTDLGKDTSTVGLGDITLGARWEPFPLEKDRLPLIFNGNVTLPTGESPYEINRDKGLSTGRGYYGIGGGVSTRKYIDPVVLFGSASLNYGFEKDGLDQKLGNRTLVAVRPNLGAGIALGFAYSLNYDVSLTMSYQQSFSVGSEFTRRGSNKDGKLVEEEIASADQTSAILNMALGVRVSPKTIVNTSIGIGLTEDTPDVSFGVSFPLDFAGFGKK